MFQTTQRNSSPSKAKDGSTNKAPGVDYARMMQLQTEQSRSDLIAQMKENPPAQLMFEEPSFAGASEGKRPTFANRVPPSALAVAQATVDKRLTFAGATVGKEVQTKSKPGIIQNQNQNQGSGSNTQMPVNVRAKMENSFGTDFSNVNIHTNSQKADGLNARAYTQGNDIHFNSGEYNPQSRAGQELLGHELTHVVQQRAGRVKGTQNKGGVNVNTDKSLEHEADVMGRRAAEGKSVSTNSMNSSSVSDSVQLSKKSDETKTSSSFTAPFNDGKEGKTYTITILVDQPGSGGDRDTYEMNGTEVDVGHTFVQLTKVNKDGSKVISTFGFYPSKKVNPIFGPIEVPGELNNDTVHTHEVKHTTTVSEVNFKNALKYVDDHHSDKYNLNTYNCTDFAIRTAGAAGVTVADTSGVWPGGGGSNPGDLGEDIRGMKKKP